MKGTNGHNTITGTPTNPHNPNYYPGGSSSASATTVASNLLPLTLGRDGGGSIRIPSTYCGIYGLKPTHSRVGQSPTVSIALSTSVTGPMASSIADLELGYRTLATPDPFNKASSQFSPPIPPSPSSSSSKKRPLGICKPWFDAADPAVLNLCHEALAHYTSLGYETISIDLPYLHEGQLAHTMTISAEAGTAVSNIRDFTPSTQLVLATCGQTPAQDFLLAQKMRNLLMTHLAFLWKKYPGLLIVTPTTPNAGWEIRALADLEREVSDSNMALRNMTYIWLANFTGCPAIAVPVGRAEGKNGKGQGKVPVGLMAMAEWGDEEALFEWGRVAEEWAWGKEGKMEKPEGWIDVLGLAAVRK